MAKRYFYACYCSKDFSNSSTADARPPSIASTNESSETIFQFLSSLITLITTSLPGVDVEGMEDTKDMLHAAIDALRANNLNGFADEMINRYYSVVEDKGRMTVRSQQLGIILDYVYFIEEKYNIDDAYTEEDKQVPDGPALEPDPDLPF